MAATAKRHLISLSVCLTFLACSAKDDEIRGQVFIVTKARANVTMGLVEVAAYEKREAMAAIQAHQSRLRRFIETQTPPLRAAQRNLAVAESALAAVRRIHNVRSSQAGLEDAFFKGKISSEQFNEGRAFRWRDDIQAILHAEQDVDRCKAECAAIVSRITTAGSDDSLFTALPPPVALAKTDANGEFEIRLPRRGSCLIGARAGRDVLGSTEEYAWLVEIPKDALAGQKLLLSNDNIRQRDSLVVSAIGSGEVSRVAP